LAQETSKLFAKEGAKVCLAALCEAELQKAVDEITTVGGEAMYMKVKKLHLDTHQPATRSVCLYAI
jgi:NADP-dependent 3-hydroxy acid dehydrogenase YdfG